MIVNAEVTVMRSRVAANGSASRLGDFYLPPVPIDDESPRHETLGVFAHPVFFFLGIAIASGIALARPHLAAAERRLASRHAAEARRIDTFLRSGRSFAVALVVLALFGAFEIVMQPPFVNDWPAHLHHVEQFLLDGTHDYSLFMHNQGPCTYPGGFLFLYSLIVKCIGYSLQSFQLLWIIFEVLCLLGVRRLATVANLSPLVYWLPLLSNRLHLYNVRVVVNDLPPVMFSIWGLALALQGRLFWTTTLFSLALSNKLNFILHLPSLGVWYLISVGFLPTLAHFLWAAFLQICLGLPFLSANPTAYISLAYDLGRTLLWEKTRNFRWLGRAVYNQPTTPIFLLALGACIVLSGLVTLATRPPSPRRNLLILLWSNAVFCWTARGLYTPMMCWFFYTLPIVSQLTQPSLGLTVVVWGVFEVLWRFLGSHSLEIWASYVVFLANALILLPSRDSIRRLKEE